MSDIWVGVVGAVLGGALGAGATLAAQFLNIRQANATRFMEDRRQLYGRLLYECDLASNAISEIAEQGPLPSSQLEVPGEVIQAIQRSNRDNDEILLTGSREVSNAANKMILALGRLTTSTANLTGPASVVPEWGRCREQLTAARRGFVEMARQELGV